MLGDLIFTYWLFFPAGVANMAPVLANHWRWLEAFNRPIDAGKSWRGKRLLGDNKTWRGLIAGWILAVPFVFLQFWLYYSGDTGRNFYQVDFDSLNPLLWSVALAVGALGGDIIKSFFKRQLNIKPGHNWVPFDQIDFVVGTLLVSSLLIDLETRFYIMAIALGLFLHPLVNLLGWLLKIKDKPF